eukprot:TRINITY_DN4441_c0_g1_i1.p1 TRINITY_DN4441_c0_g1~~TRINITY_DN4441_c0_g1_i1.p1  ORF type:complete len:409 (+),score=90.81 TRINITY_DN4441_c0_g1_i1:1-1227(+)
MENILSSHGLKLSTAGKQYIQDEKIDSFDLFIETINLRKDGLLIVPQLVSVFDQENDRRVEGPVIVQVTKAVNVGVPKAKGKVYGRNRLLTVWFTDGHATGAGIELEYLEVFDGNLSGVKMELRNFRVRDRFVLFDRETDIRLLSKKKEVIDRIFDIKVDGSGAPVFTDFVVSSGNNPKRQNSNRNQNQKQKGNNQKKGITKNQQNKQSNKGNNGKPSNEGNNDTQKGNNQPNQNNNQRGQYKKKQKDNANNQQNQQSNTGNKNRGNNGKPNNQKGNANNQRNQQSNNRGNQGNRGNNNNHQKGKFQKKGGNQANNRNQHQDDRKQGPTPFTFENIVQSVQEKRNLALPSFTFDSVKSSMDGNTPTPKEEPEPVTNQNTNQTKGRWAKKPKQEDNGTPSKSRYRKKQN